MRRCSGLRPRVKLGFNLTARHFDNETIVEEVREIFAGSPIRLSQIVLEVTERQPLEDLDMARRVIAALQELGCKVAIDDVGTGHGGLSYMLKLGVNYIKIDKMFVDAIGTERYSTTIIETLIEPRAQHAHGDLRRRRRDLRAGQISARARDFPRPGLRLRAAAARARCSASCWRPPIRSGPAAAHAGDAPAAVGEFMAARDRVAAA